MRHKYKLVNYLLRTRDKNQVPDVLEETNYLGDTLLIEAAKQGEPQMVRSLINNGANVLACNISTYKDSALSWSVFRGNTDCSRILIESGGDLRHQTCFDGNTLLMWAYKQSCINDFALLLHSGAPMRLKNKANKDIIDICSARRDEYSYMIDDFRRTLTAELRDRMNGYDMYEKSLVNFIMEYI
jgi:ankyrin repeat protein